MSHISADVVDLDGNLTETRDQNVMEPRRGASCCRASVFILDGRTYLSCAQIGVEWKAVADYHCIRGRRVRPRIPGTGLFYPSGMNASRKHRVEPDDKQVPAKSDRGPQFIGGSGSDYLTGVFMSEALPLDRAESLSNNCIQPP
jgi:hypothetical protein